MEKDLQRLGSDEQKAFGFGVGVGDANAKLWIKLKIPKAEQVLKEKDGIGFDGLETTTDQLPILNRVCYVCNKGFSSGKALGGHMRVHVQRKEIPPRQKLKPNHQICNGLGFQSPRLVVDLTQRKKVSTTTAVNVGGASTTGLDKPICSLCGKNFPSIKSLFGHMRCHPERGWRGMQPPPPKNSSSFSSVADLVTQKIDSTAQINRAAAAVMSSAADVPPVDLVQSLRGWSVTAKRGRKISDEKQLKEGVGDLMMLAHGNSFDESGLTNKQTVEEAEATNNSNSMDYKFDLEQTNQLPESKKRSQVVYKSDYPGKKSRIDEKGSYAAYKYYGKGKEKAVQECDFDDLNSCSDDDDGSDIGENAQQPQRLSCSHFDQSSNGKASVAEGKERRKVRKKIKLMDLGASPAKKPILAVSQTTPDKYRCSTCNKCFPTHQALGGHRSSHNKFKISIQNAMNESSSTAAVPDQDDKNASPIDETKESEGASSSKQQIVESAHLCTICNKNFPTGQALGGHKRCHWTSPVEVVPSSQSTSPDETSQTGRKGLDIDLNMPPAVEGEAEGGTGFDHAACYGYLSSSYNSLY